MHLLPTLQNARELRKPMRAIDAVIEHAARPVNLLEQVDDLYSRAKGLLDKAERAEKFGNAASALREATRLCELLGRLQGDLTIGTTSTVNVLITSTPEWLDLRQRLLTALRPHPQALEAVKQALSGAEASDQLSDDGAKHAP